MYLLGSIHVLRPTDYPLAPVVTDAYKNSKALCMEVDLGAVDSGELQAEMLAGAALPADKSLAQIMGPERYAQAQKLTHDVGLDLSMFDQFAPWFAAEAISQMQLAQLGFSAQSGVEMYFLDRAHADGKSVVGLETVHDQIALFQKMPLDAQADYLVSSLKDAHDLPAEVDDMVLAWRRGDTAWFEKEMKGEMGTDSALYQALIVIRNRKWISRIEAMLDDDKNYLVIVGTAHLVGRDSVIELLRKDGIAAAQH